MERLTDAERRRLEKLLARMLEEHPARLSLRCSCLPSPPWRPARDRPDAVTPHPGVEQNLALDQLI
jgi:hypothetical protein